MQYQVMSLYKTEEYEKDFDYQYHEKYLNKIGYEVEHHHQSKIFKDFKCIKFSEYDVDWFHKEDLKIMEI